MKTRSLLAFAAAICFSAALTSHGETVRLPVGQQANDVWQGKTPSRGSLKSQVEAQFGSPDSVEGPAGEPPISFWEYPDFTVYFEHNHVIHTVIKHRPKTQ